MTRLSKLVCLIKKHQIKNASKSWKNLFRKAMRTCQTPTATKQRRRTSFILMSSWIKLFRATMKSLSSTRRWTKRGTLKRTLKHGGALSKRTVLENGFTRITTTDWSKTLKCQIGSMSRWERNHRLSWQSTDWANESEMKWSTKSNSVSRNGSGLSKRVTIPSKRLRNANGKRWKTKATTIRRLCIRTVKMMSQATTLMSQRLGRGATKQTNETILNFYIQN